MYTSLAVLLILLAPYIIVGCLVGIFARTKKISIGKDHSPEGHPFSVTIYIPTLNEEKMIARKLDNLMLQTYDIDEILIYDCSSDNTPQIIQEYGKRYPRIKLIIQPERIGAARTFNQALLDAKGEIIIKTDADVILKSRDAIQKLVSNFVDPQMGGASAVYVKEAGIEKYYRSVMTKIQVAESNVDSTLIAHTGLLAFRKSAISLVDPNSMAEDTEEFILIRKKGYRTIVDESVKAEEEIPDNFALRRKQRDRRAQGIIKAMMKNKEIFFNPKFGKYGSIVFPMELFIIGLSPFLLMAIAGVFTYILYQISPLFLGLLAIPGILFATKSKMLFSALDTQISGLVATSKYILGKDEPLWSKVR